MCIMYAPKVEFLTMKVLTQMVQWYKKNLAGVFRAATAGPCCDTARLVKIG